MISLLLVGDVHAGKDTLPQVRILMQTLLEIMKNPKKPDAIIFMGDLLDRFEQINLYAHHMLVTYFMELSKYGAVVVIIGNHDRGNPSDFQSDVHPFTALSRYKDIYIADRAKHITLTIPNQEKEIYRLVFVPYVPPGRLNEALETLRVSIRDDVPTAIFAHQEFAGVELGGGMISTKGDPWPKDAPFLFSGHIHRYQHLKPNLVYVGTPYQVSYSEHGDGTKGVLLVVFDRPHDRPKITQIPITNIPQHRVIMRLGNEKDIHQLLERNLANKDSVRVYLTDGLDDTLLKTAGYSHIHRLDRRSTPRVDDTDRLRNGRDLLTVWIDLVKEDEKALKFLTETSQILS